MKIRLVRNRRKKCNYGRRKAQDEDGMSKVSKKGYLKTDKFLLCRPTEILRRQDNRLDSSR